jgi:hypothetical protein
MNARNEFVRSNVEIGRGAFSSVYFGTHTVRSKATHLVDCAVVDGACCRRQDGAVEFGCIRRDSDTRVATGSRAVVHTFVAPSPTFDATVGHFGMANVIEATACYNGRNPMWKWDW